MKYQNWINRAVNIGLFWSFCLLASSGLVLKYRLGTEFYDPTGATIWGMDWKAWATLHLILGLLICSLIVIHLWMNRLWLWRVACRQRNWAILFGILLGLALLLGPLLSTLSPGSGG